MSNNNLPTNIKDLIITKTKFIEINIDGDTYYSFFKELKTLFYYKKDFNTLITDNILRHG